MSTADVWTADRVLGLAPDAASAKNGRGLAKPGKWKGTGRDASALWGLCQGSGKDPYKTAIDIENLAYKCSCPSRKLPCKHALGLLLLLAEQGSTIPEGAEPPEWVATWIAGRRQRAEAKASQPAEAKPVDPAKVAKKQQNRIAKARDGLDELQLWMSDLVRRGLAQLQAESYDTWDRIAARMVDAQIPAVARELRGLAGKAMLGKPGLATVLEKLGRLHLLAEATRRYDDLTEPEQHDLRVALGIPLTQAEVVAAGTPFRDQWIVIGETLEEDDGDNLCTLSTWLYGTNTKGIRLRIQYAPRANLLDRTLAPGLRTDAELVDYPGTVASRCVVHVTHGIEGCPLDAFPDGIEDWSVLLDAYSEQVAARPWIDTRAALLAPEAVEVGPRPGVPARLVDAAGQALPLDCPESVAQTLAALIEEEPLTLLVEYDGRALAPVSFWTSTRFLRASKIVELWSAPAHAGA